MSLGRWMVVNVIVVVLAGGVMVFLRTIPPPPDPNDPSQVGTMKPTVLRRNLKQTSDAANSRVMKGQMSPLEAKDKVSEAAERMLEGVSADNIPDEDLWEYGEVLWTAKEWKKAIPVLEKAVKVAKTEDRRINDSLRLAKCYAGDGDVKKGIATVRTTFDASPQGTAPLLNSLVFEFVPIAKGKGQDAELVKLLEEAIPIYQKTEVDPKSEGGQRFLAARPAIIREAQRQIAELKGAGSRLRIG